MTTLEAYQQAIADLRRQALNAAARNKPTMWAYLSDCADGLDAWLIEPTDDEALFACLGICERATLICGASDIRPTEAARIWALSVYARRILRASGQPAPRASLAWLRELTGAVRP